MFRWRTTSYKKAPQATETLRELIVPSIGKEERSSQQLMTDFEIPFPSDPITMQTDSSKEVS